MSKTKTERQMTWQVVSSFNPDTMSVSEAIETLKVYQKLHGKQTRLVIGQVHNTTVLVIEAWKPVLTQEEELAAARNATLAAYSNQ
jgi:hypothetical protein